MAESTVNTETLMNAFQFFIDPTKEIESCIKKRRSSDNLTLKVKKFKPEAILPKRATKGSSGYDLFAIEDGIVPAHGKCDVEIGIGIKIPDGYSGRISCRSSLGKKMLCVGAGVIDADYTGPIQVMLFNHSNEDFKFAAGNRIAQLLLEKICTPEVEEVEELEQTERGGNGFGSTGV